MGLLLAPGQVNKSPLDSICRYHPAGGAWCSTAPWNGERREALFHKPRAYAAVWLGLPAALAVFTLMANPRKPQVPSRCRCHHPTAQLCEQALEWVTAFTTRQPSETHATHVGRIPRKLVLAGRSADATWLLRRPHATTEWLASTCARSGEVLCCSVPTAFLDYPNRDGARTRAWSIDAVDLSTWLGGRSMRRLPPPTRALCLACTAIPRADSVVNDM